jgi:hypothetical protein
VLTIEITVYTKHHFRYDGYQLVPSIIMFLPNIEHIASQVLKYEIHVQCILVVSHTHALFHISVYFFL